MRRLFVPGEQLAAAREGLLPLSPEQARYLGAVLRLRAGDAVEVFDGKGARLEAHLAEGGTTGLALRLGSPARSGSGPGAHLVLAQALSKGDKLELVVQKATELGVARIIPFAAERSVVRLAGERAEARAQRFRRIAQEAARQCGRADVPEVDAPAGWDALFALAGGDPDMRCILLDGSPGGASLGQAACGAAPADGPARILVTVGPEGGFSPAERAQAIARGFVAASLGPLTLRTETAGLAALAILQHLEGVL